MALGTLGSTLSDELNRLANGGTYRDMNQMVDEALAAKQWANRENISPYSTDTVGILNEIAGLGLDKRNWLDFNGVCNYIAGTTGLPAAAALRQVYATTDLLTGVASYYVDATSGSNYIPTTASGFMYLPGVAGNYAATPDANVLDITGDIDIRVKVELDDWTPVGPGEAIILTKYGASGNRSWYFNVATDGTLSLLWSTNGTNLIGINSTLPTNLASYATSWIRVTLDVDNGAGGRTAKFYTSTDGTTWTQLGTDVTQSGTTSIFASTAALEVGSANVGTAVSRGKFYRAQVRNGIDGTVVFDANFETAMTSQTVASFTEGSSNAATVTINRTTYNFQLDTINNLGAAGSLLPTTLGSSTAADSNDPKFLDHTGTNYVYLPGVAASLLSVAVADSPTVTGDFEAIVYMAADDWTPAAAGPIFARWGADPNRHYNMQLNTNGTLVFQWTPDGTYASRLTSTSTVAPTVADGATLGLKVTLDVDNGSSQNETKFYTSTDNGATWTQLGSTITKSGTTSIYGGGSIDFRIGRWVDDNSSLAGKYNRVIIKNGIGGTTLLDVDTSVITAGSATSFTAVTGQTVTISRSTSGRKTVAVTQPTWLFGTDDYMEVNNRYMSSGTYLYLPGVNGNYASTPDAAALDIMGDIDLRVKVALDDWTPATNMELLSKTQSTSQRSWRFYLATNGTLQFFWSADGTNQLGAISSVATGVSDGATKWVRVTLDVDNGASGNSVQFFLSDDGTTWTQLGSTITTAGTTSIFNSTSILEVGTAFAGTSTPARGKFFRAQVLNGIDGTVAFDANFETSITSLLQTSFTESSANAATVTINRSGSTYRSAGITTAGYLYPGATNTFSASATDFLNFGATDNFTVIAVTRYWNAEATGRVIVGIGSGNTSMPFWRLYKASNTLASEIGIGSSFTNFTQSRATAITAGALETSTGIMNRNTQLLQSYSNTNPSTAVSISSISSTYNNLTPMRIGTYADNAAFTNIELYAVGVFRQTLTTRQINQIVNYFARREAYL